MKLIRISGAMALCVASGVYVYAQTPPIQATSQEVLVDVVVHDKHGRPVKDLKASDFAVYDNGQQKPIKNFRLVQGSETVSATGERAKLDPLRQIRLITLLYDNLDLNSRRLASAASLDLLKEEFPQNVYMSVMTIGHRLSAVQPYTNDRELLRKAIERVTGSETFDYGAVNEQVVQDLERQAAAPAPAAPTGPDSGSAISADGAAYQSIAMARMMLDTLTLQNKSDSAFLGRSQVFSLFDVVKQQYEMPGRKTILYFTTGLNLPQSTDQAFEHMIATANQNNVSFYCVDARGLITSAMNQGASKTLDGAAQQSVYRQQHPNDALTAADMNVMDDSINSMRANTQNNLATLADSTGGMLIANTNDFRAPLRKLADDVETYYELSYDPQIANNDGSFHKIAVRVEPKDLRVQSRSGYFALPPALHGTVLNAYEVPLLKALDRTPLVHDFAFHSAGMVFPGAQPVCEIVLDVPLANVTLKDNPTTKMHEGNISYVAVVKNEKGEIASKFSNEIPLKVPSDKMSALEKSHFIYTERVNLSPGHYRLETAVLDRGGNRISVRKAVLFLPAESGKLALSSVVPVRSTKPASTNADAADPLVIGKEAITPTLDPTVSKSQTRGIPFYLVIYPDKSSTEKPELAMEFSRDGQVLGSGRPQLTAPDASGKIPYVATAPVEQLQPGNYQIRFVVKQGTELAQQIATFTLTP